MLHASRVPGSSSSLVALGFAAACGQAALLREAMAALGGSELAWGAVLGIWLLGMGAGSWLGATRRGGAVAGLTPAVLVTLAGAGVVLLRAAPALVGAVTGEAIGTVQALWVWVAAVLPAAFAGGLGFAALASAGTAAGAYALESLGALAGGVAFTFILAPLGSMAALVIALGAVLAIQMAARGRRLAAALSLGAAFAAAAPAGDVVARLGWRWAGRAGTLTAWRDTRAQRLELAGGPPASLYGDGTLLGTFPDPYVVTPRGHLLLLLHPAPRRVLAVGAIADGTLPTLLRHPLERLDLAEDDSELPALLSGWYGAAMAKALADPRVVVHSDDPLRLVARGGGWDEILLLDPDPATLRHARTRTREFFRACAAALVPGGVLVVRVGVPDTYLGGAGGRLVAIVASTLRTAFPVVTAVPGEEILMVASRRDGSVTLDPAVLVARWRALGVDDPGFTPDALPVLLDPERAAELELFLATAAGPENRRDRPAAVPVAAALREARGAPPLLRALSVVERYGGGVLLATGALLATAVIIAGARPRAAGVAAAAAVGFVSMGWWLALLAAWQATVGSVYSQVGALSAAFMAGIAGGAAAARARGDGAARALPGILLAGVALSLVLALEIPLEWPRAVCVPALVLAGTLTGAAFPGVAALAGVGAPGTGAGRGFAADEVGAAVAALLVGLLALPVVGMRATALALAVIGAAAVLSTAIAVRRGGARVDRDTPGPDRR